MTTKQTMLQFVQQIMHEGIDALIDRIACRVIERLDERNAAKQHNMEATVQPPAADSPIAADNVQALKTSDITPHATNEDGACETSCTLTERAMQMVDEMYDTRYNVLDRVAEIRHHNNTDAPFVPVSKLVRNTIVIDLHKRGCMVWNNDVDRILESSYMTPYHPFTSYLKSLPAWDGRDRVTPLAMRVSHDTLWCTVFHRWLRGMVAGWYGADRRTACGSPLGTAANATGGNAMIPLLVSEEQGLRKSTFCRMLLPDDLRRFTPTNLN